MCVFQLTLNTISHFTFLFAHYFSLTFLTYSSHRWKAEHFDACFSFIIYSPTFCWVFIGPHDCYNSHWTLEMPNHTENLSIIPRFLERKYVQYDKVTVTRPTSFLEKKRKGSISCYIYCPLIILIQICTNVPFRFRSCTKQCV